jgi:uncharacterized protein (TIGR02246 family)
MKALAILCGATVIALTITACTSAPPPAPPDTHDADVKAINDLETEWNQSYATKDADKISSYYADDAVLMVPGEDAMHGKDAIHAGYKQMVADPAMSLKFHADRVEVAKSGEMAYSAGKYELTATDSATHKVINDHGSYVTTYRKQADGSWKAVADIATSAVPPMPPPKKK